jgi:DNA-binding IscR family transcriptional regulator
VEGRLSTRKCLLGEPVCKGAPCVLGGIINSVNRDVREHFENTRLSDFSGLSLGTGG